MINLISEEQQKIYLKAQNNDPFSELVNSKDNSLKLRQLNYLLIEAELERLIELKKKK